MSRYEPGHRGTRDATLRRGWFGRIFLAGLVVMMGGCATEIHHGLEESAANELIVSLVEDGIPAVKEVDDIHGGWLIAVPRTVGHQAMQLLAARGLPRNNPREGEGSGVRSLVPSPSQEHEERVRLRAERVEEALLAFESVLDAHVQVAIDEEEDWSSCERDARASVLLSVIEGRVPPTLDEVQSLTSGAFEGLNSERVAVVWERVLLPSAASEVNVAMGPFVVAASSIDGLRLLIAGLFVGCCSLALGLLFVGLRLFSVIHLRGDGGEKD